MAEYRRLPPQSHPCDRDEIIDEYEVFLLRAKFAALTTAGLLSCSSAVGSCFVLWGLVVVLGGFGSALHSDDFLLVTLLGFLVHFRGYAASFVYSWVVNLKLPRKPANPKFLQYSDEYCTVLRTIAGMGNVAQLLFVLPGLLLPSWRLSDVQFGVVRNLDTSLIIFYLGVITSCTFALLAVIFDFLFFTVIFTTASLTLRRYYYELCQRALRLGLAEVENVDFFAFVFRTLAQDYSRNVQPLTVKKQNEDVIQYLYAHRKGAEVATRYLESTDVWEQQAAANMIGFWAREKGIATQSALLSRLAGKLEGATQTSWAAANSLSILAETRPLLVANISVGSKNFLDFLVDLLDKSNPMCLVHTRILISLFRHKDIVRGLDDQRVTNVESKLREIFYFCNRQRLRTAAAYGLMLVGRLTEEDKEMIGNIYPEKDAYFLSTEKKLLEELRQAVGLGQYSWGKFEVRDVKPG